MYDFKFKLLYDFRSNIEHVMKFSFFLCFAIQHSSFFVSMLDI